MNRDLLRQHTRRFLLLTAGACTFLLGGILLTHILVQDSDDNDTVLYFPWIVSLIVQLGIFIPGLFLRLFKKESLEHYITSIKQNGIVACLYASTNFFSYIAFLWLRNTRLYIVLYHGLRIPFFYFTSTSFLGRKYRTFEIVATVTLVFSFFFLAACPVYPWMVPIQQIKEEAKKLPSNVITSIFGLLFLGIALVLDSSMFNTIEYTYFEQGTSFTELLMVTMGVGSILSLIGSILSGEWVLCINALIEHTLPTIGILASTLFFIGAIVCLFCIAKHHGVLITLYIAMVPPLLISCILAMKYFYITTARSNYIAYSFGTILFIVSIIAMYYVQYGRLKEGKIIGIYDDIADTMARGHYSYIGNNTSNQNTNHTDTNDDDEDDDDDDDANNDENEDDKNKRTHNIEVGVDMDMDMDIDLDLDLDLDMDLEMGEDNAKITKSKDSKSRRNDSRNDQRNNTKKTQNQSKTKTKTKTTSHDNNIELANLDSHTSNEDKDTIPNKLSKTIDIEVGNVAISLPSLQALPISIHDIPTSEARNADSAIVNLTNYDPYADGEDDLSFL